MKEVKTMVDILFDVDEAEKIENEKQLSLEMTENETIQENDEKTIEEHQNFIDELFERLQKEEITIKEYHSKVRKYLNLNNIRIYGENVNL